MDISKIIKDLEKEIVSNRHSQESEKVLLRLQEMAKDYQGEDRIVSSLELAERIRNMPPERKMMTGFGKLDEILDGFRPKQLIVMSAATKSGKTSMCVELTIRMKDENPMWLPFEESAEEIIRKFIDRNEDVPLFYTPSRMSGNTLQWVEKKIIEAKAKHDCKLVFIDHLHFIVDLGENMSVQIGRTMRELKRMAKEWDVTIVLIAHLKKTKMSEQPDLEDLRDSSFIAQEADTVIMLWRQTYEADGGEVIITNNVNVSVQANRRTGRTGNVKMAMESGVFVERHWEDHKAKKLKSWGE